MDFYAIELQIMEVDRLLAQSDLSADDRAAAILQKKYLVSEGVENDSFFSALKIQESLNNLTIQEQSDEDYARTLAREPQRDHGVINRQLRANIDAVNRAKVISGDTASALIDACRSALKSFAQTDDDYNSDDDNATQSGEKGDPSFSNSIFGDSAKGPTQVADVTFPAVLPGTTRAKCSVCLDVKGVVELQCKHNHCRKCLHKIFLNAVEDRSLMPVRCCRIPIDKKICSAVLNTREAEKYFSALEEVEAPNKMYCPRKDCGAFINLDKFATGPKLMFCCPKCAQPLCSSCKADHRPLSCAQYLAMPEENRNLEDAAFLQLAKQEKFARCLQCGQFVQLIEGCNHMTCKCSFQFCYECNAKWKTCPCSVWDEQRLIRAGQVEAGPRRNDVAVVGRRMQELVRAEYCDPHDWVRVNSGDRQCQNCPFYMYVYHYKCTECNRRICYTCRFYRI